MAKKISEIRRKLSYIKIGVFFLAGLMLFFISLILIQDTVFFRPSYELNVVFEFAEGLKRASPVRFCGVDIGQIREVRVISSPEGAKVKVRASLEKGIKIPRDSHFFINSLSLFGEKYLEIIPPAQFSGYLDEGEIIKGMSPVPLFQLFAGFNKTMEEIKSFIEDGQIKESMERTIENLEKISFETKILISGLKEKKGTVGRLFYDDSLYRKTEEFISDIKENPWKLLHKPRQR